MNKTLPEGKPLNLGVIVEVSPRAGGRWQQAVNTLLIASQLDPTICRVTVFALDLAAVKAIKSKGMVCFHINFPTWRRMLSVIRSNIENGRLLFAFRKLFGSPFIEKILEEKNIDIVLFTGHTALAKSFEQINYIATVFDLCHASHPEFPEVRFNREFERRERAFRAVLPRATAIFVDSEISRHKVSLSYSIGLDRIFVFPFMPAAHLGEPQRRSTLSKLAKPSFLENRYVFYPAQFWPHKNHAYLLRGIRILELKYLIYLDVVFVGRDAGANEQYIRKLALDLGISNRVHFLGYVNDEDMTQLYRESVALVMPTYFGPTNLPPLEAFHLGVPVIHANSEEFATSLGGAALLVDLKDPSSLAEMLRRLLSDQELRSALAVRGKALLEERSAISHLEILSQILCQFGQRRSCWQR